MGGWTNPPISRIWVKLDHSPETYLKPPPPRPRPLWLRPLQDDPNHFPRTHGLRRKRYASLQVPLQAVHSRHSPHCPFSQAPPQFSSPQIGRLDFHVSMGDVNMYTYCTYVKSIKCFYISVIFTTKQHWTSWLLLLSTSFWIFFYNSFLTLFLWQVAGTLAKRAATFDMPICH